MMTITHAVPADCFHLAKLAMAFRDHLQRSLPSDQQFLDSIAILLNSADAEFYLCRLDDSPAGYVLQRFRHSMWASGSEATLEDLFVDPRLRRSGLGGELVRFAVQRARDKGCKTICLDTNENNVASQRIYTQLGFDSFSKRWQGNQIFFRLNLA